jgi:2-polyprenyl-3-methyl-5-hydroxy-6-metoxy-1,4-benzoquinol methylase
MGQAMGQLVLDCSRGWGRQTIALTELGWQVSACNVSETSLAFARKFASQEGLLVDFQVGDMRDLAHAFNQRFDWLVVVLPCTKFRQTRAYGKPFIGCLSF